MNWAGIAFVIMLLGLCVLSWFFMDGPPPKREEKRAQAKLDEIHAYRILEKPYEPYDWEKD